MQQVGYCIKCKAKREFVEVIDVVLVDGRKAIKGKCAVCGSFMFKILSTKNKALTSQLNQACS